jgi:hypothetical protein
MPAGSFFLRTRLFWFFTLPASLFVGLMIASAGTAIYPPVTALGTPFVCDGTVDIQSHGASYRPGEYTVTREIYCVGDDGKTREDITLKAMFASFLVYSALAFALLGLVVVPLLRRPFGRMLAPFRTQSSGPAHGAPGNLDDILAQVSDAMARGDARVVVRNMTFGQAGASDPAERLAQLKRLRDDGLITAADYEAKKAEILSGL